MISDRRKQYLKAFVLGLVIIAAGILCLNFAPGLKVPALPNVRIPLTPFLLTAGTILSLVAILLFKDTPNDE